MLKRLATTLKRAVLKVTQGVGHASVLREEAEHLLQVSDSEFIISIFHLPPTFEVWDYNHTEAPLRIVQDSRTYSADSGFLVERSADLLKVSEASSGLVVLTLKKKMGDVKRHYDDLLSDVYTWYAAGGRTTADYDARCDQYKEYFASVLQATPGGGNKNGGVAVDLGCGSGLQSIPLSVMGYNVVSIDLCDRLLQELQRHAERHSVTSRIRPFSGDIMQFQTYLREASIPEINLAVCMVDTILHLPSKEHVRLLFSNVFSSLASGGSFILSLRNLTAECELKNESRFLPVCSCETKIFTCFLEYFPDYVNVHDLIHELVSEPDGTKHWVQKCSSYHKLRLHPTAEVIEMLKAVGFSISDHRVIRGMSHICATKP
ncbi:class I SAM-dependent methyltransferase [Pelomyxa schiedti]|nr:class I SAM-dependent methyltransferase [Pelomyxa schiedti]